MTSRRLGRILDFQGEVGDPDTSLDWLCGTCAEQLAVSGTAVALILSGQDPGNIAASDEVAAAVVDLQFSTGEGPAVDAHRTRRAVLEPELSSSTRWPAFAPEAVAVGAAAVFALPLQVGAARSGALILYRNRPGPLGEGVLTDALAMAEVACEITLGLQAQVPPGSLHEVFDRLAAKRTELYQATGMVVVQLDVGPAEAVAAIRARAMPATVRSAKWPPMSSREGSGSSGEGTGTIGRQPHALGTGRPASRRSAIMVVHTSQCRAEAKR